MSSQVLCTLCSSAVTLALGKICQFKEAVSWLFSLFLSQIFVIFIEGRCSCINWFQSTKET